MLGRSGARWRLVVYDPRAWSTIRRICKRIGLPACTSRRSPTRQSGRRRRALPNGDAHVVHVLSMAVSLSLAIISAFAQVDIAGTWATRMHEDWMERWPGPDPGNFSGLPLNGRTRACAELLAVATLDAGTQCLYYPQTYRVVDPSARASGRSMAPTATSSPGA